MSLLSSLRPLLAVKVIQVASVNEPSGCGSWGVMWRAELVTPGDGDWLSPCSSPGITSVGAPDYKQTCQNPLRDFLGYSAD